MDNYSRIVERIAISAKVEKEEIDRKVEAKRAKLSGLVSKEGAAQIVAAELGVNFDQERLKVSELLHGMKKANVVAKVLEVFPVREFNKNGREGKVANLVIADDTGNMKVVLWDTNHIALIESKEIVEGVVLEISNGMIRNGEIHLSSFSDIKKSAEEIKDVVTKKTYATAKLVDVRSGMKAEIRAFVVQCSDPKFFVVSKETGKKVDQEKIEEYAPDSIEKRALLSVVLDDGSESMRVVMFGNVMKGLGLTEEEIFDLEKFNAKKPFLLGVEKLFTGNVRSNQLYNTTEMIVEGMEDVNPAEIIKALEA
jgi:hypothetical protein